MEFTEIDELNDMIVYSKSYRPSLIPKFTKYFDFDFKAPQDLNFVSLDELMENSFEDLQSPEIRHKPSQKINVGVEKSNETIEDILEDISNSMANFDIGMVSPVLSPKKYDDGGHNQQMKPIDEEAENKFEESPRQERKKKTEANTEMENKDIDTIENKDDDKKVSSLDDKKNFLKLENENVSQTFTEKRKITSCLTENIKQNKGPVILDFS